MNRFNALEQVSLKMSWKHGVRTLTVCSVGSFELAASRILSTVVEVTLLASRSTPSELAPSVIFGAAGGQLHETFVAGVVQFFRICFADSSVLYTMVGGAGLRREMAAIKINPRMANTIIFQEIPPQPRPFTLPVPLLFCPRSLTIVYLKASPARPHLFDCMSNAQK